MAEASGRIRALPPTTSRLIGSSHALSSVKAIVKELVENAIDAGATSIEVILKDAGLKSISVKDNGSGIGADDCKLLAKQHCTSKLVSFDDLSSIQTLGFRGQALGALCATTTKVTISTSVAGESGGRQYQYDKAGNVLSESAKAMSQGTIVSVEQCFDRIPVRFKHLRQQARKHVLASVRDLLFALGLARPEIKLSLRCDKPMCTWVKRSCPTVLDAVRTSFDASLTKALCEVSAESEDKSVRLSAVVPVPDADPKAVCRSAPDRCFTVINGRPVQVDFVRSIVKELCPASAPQVSSQGTTKRNRKFPFCVVSMTMPPSWVDVNACPDKAKVLLQQEEELSSLLSSALGDLYVEEQPDPVLAREAEGEVGGCAAKHGAGDQTTRRQEQVDRTEGFDQGLGASAQAVTTQPAVFDDSDHIDEMELSSAKPARTIDCSDGGDTRLLARTGSTGEPDPCSDSDLDTDAFRSKPQSKRQRLDTASRLDTARGDDHQTTNHSNYGRSASGDHRHPWDGDAPMLDSGSDRPLSHKRSLKRKSSSGVSSLPTSTPPRASPPPARGRRPSAEGIASGGPIQPDPRGLPGACFEEMDRDNGSSDGWARLLDGSPDDTKKDDTKKAKSSRDGRQGKTKRLRTQREQKEQQKPRNSASERPTRKTKPSPMPSGATITSIGPHYASILAERLTKPCALSDSFGDNPARLIGQVKGPLASQGSWLCCLSKHRLATFNAWRAQEVGVFDNLVANNTFPSLCLDPPFKLDVGVVGGAENWAVLQRLPTRADNLQAGWLCVVDPVLVLNGFNIRVQPGSQVAWLDSYPDIKQYVVSLHAGKDIASLLSSVARATATAADDTSVVVRLPKILLHYEAEVVRMCREHPGFTTTEAQDLFTTCIVSHGSGSGDEEAMVCPHNKPVFDAFGVY
eukprot:m.261547 g.261547  ORF g.261547 m.261547 type:complete len:914 (+) comp19225_c1_seq13:104-2845(+)